ncbi:response regulator [Calderihabitans maritimus]|uniref:Stage 0 sporulation protein A homolog n=1 Tax=Calderihabitans maritimus TaxID=1246530 RepID=A0A1Z5HTI6_9FIRM|nr:response regulator [Calderihabitans maritimus]GAW92839.1 histidine kinase [Calderihabitans maritimus]
MKQITVLVVDDVAQTRKDISRLLYFEDDITVIGEAENGEEAVKMAENLKPDIVLMDVNMPLMDGIAATEAISCHVPETSVIIISIQGEQEYLRKAMMAGASEYLVKPFSGDELAGTIRKVYAARRKREGGTKVAETRLVEKEERGKIIAFFSGKGGVGKTTLATNFAVALARSEKGKVVLVDLDLQFGDIALFLNLDPRRTISGLVQEKDQMDDELMESYLIPHFSGVKILAAPSFPQEAELVSWEDVEQILEYLKEKYQYVIVDTACFFHDINISLLDVADHILLVTARDLASLKNLRSLAEILEQLQYHQKVGVVVNRLGSAGEVEGSIFKKALKYPVVGQIPEASKLVTESVNQGIPVVLRRGTAPFTVKIFELVGEVVGKNKVSFNRGFPIRVFWNKVLGMVLD